MRSQQLWPLGPNFELGGTRVIGTISQECGVSRRGVSWRGMVCFSGAGHFTADCFLIQTQLKTSSPDKKA